MSQFDPSLFLNSSNPVLKRLAEELVQSNDIDSNGVQASHSSHSSGTGKGHGSYVSSTMRAASPPEKDEHENSNDKV